MQDSAAMDETDHAVVWDRRGDTIVVECRTLRTHEQAVALGGLLGQRLSESAGEIVIDLRKPEVICAAGLSVLLQFGTVRTTTPRFLVMEPGSLVCRQLRMTGIDQHLPCRGVGQKNDITDVGRGHVA
ncbi:hypothetical protein J2T57_002452 [Natronocella acetinitrilica]|uniref:STAS domain-containing protein n=1 Tax=Natronocella acetinitrilica TaxID=414046 RepID=A0AAE3KC32_9GAMM|nr:hypothetical protein [Natronocella acetinitrilica]MCP1675304.1 hypothetical protein [Natronocella acetinitrilica]